MQQDLNRLKARRDVALDHMKRLGGFKFIRPQGAFYIFVDVRDHLQPGETTLKLSERLLNEHHLALAPGEAFGSPGWLRLSYAVKDETILAGIDKLHRALFK